MSPPFPQPQSGWQYAQSSPGASAMPDLSLQQFVQFDQFVRFKLFKFLFAVTWNLTVWKSKFRSIFDAMRHWTGGYVVSFAQKSGIQERTLHHENSSALEHTSKASDSQWFLYCNEPESKEGSTVDLFVIGKAHSEIPLAPRMWRATRQKVGQKNAKHMNFFQITELLLHSSQLSVDPWSLFWNRTHWTSTSLRYPATQKEPKEAFLAISALPCAITQNLKSCLRSKMFTAKFWQWTNWR